MARSRFFGTKQRIQRFVFSTKPFSHEWYGLQKKNRIPRSSASISRHFLSTMSLSVAMVWTP